MEFVPPHDEAVADNPDWADLELTPKQYEQALAQLLGTLRPPHVEGWTIEHQERVSGLDGSYVIDVTARFDLHGMAFLVLFECKQHTSPVKRQDVQVLHDKVSSTGAHKGVMVSTTGFQRGALEYAEAHGIACIRFVDGEVKVEMRSMIAAMLPDPARQPRQTSSGLIRAYQVTPTERGWASTLLSRQPEYLRHAVLPTSP